MTVQAQIWLPECRVDVCCCSGSKDLKTLMLINNTTRCPMLEVEAPDTLSHLMQDTNPIFEGIQVRLISC
jgi:hypothetical protein